MKQSPDSTGIPRLRTKRSKKEQRTGGPNGGVRIESDRHKKKLKAEERRQQLSQQDQQTAKQPAAADEDDATQRKKQAAEVAFINAVVVTL